MFAFPLHTEITVHLSRMNYNCQGCSLQLTGTRGLVGEGGVEGVLDAFGAKTAQVTISITAPTAKRQQRIGAK